MGRRGHSSPVEVGSGVGGSDGGGGENDGGGGDGLSGGSPLSEGAGVSLGAVEGGGGAGSSLPPVPDPVVGSAGGVVSCGAGCRVVGDAVVGDAVVGPPGSRPVDDSDGTAGRRFALTDAVDRVAGRVAGRVAVERAVELTGGLAGDAGRTSGAGVVFAGGAGAVWSRRAVT